MIFFPVKVSKKFNCEYNNSTHTAFSKIRAQIRVSYAFESKEFQGLFVKRHWPQMYRQTNNDSKCFHFWSKN